MPDKTILYWLTYIGLYLELCGAFLLSAEAIGKNNLVKVSEFLRKRRLISFGIYLILTITILVLFKFVFSIPVFEALILILSLGLFIDFAPRLFGLIFRYLEKGKAGVIGFLLFGLGFIVQAYVNLSQLK